MSTLAELVLSAQAAANKAVAAKDQLQVETIRLEEFAASGLDRGDYPTWLNAFNAQLDMHQMHSKQDSPATAAAKKLVKVLCVVAIALTAFTSQAQIISAPVGITNGALAAPIQNNFVPIAASEFISVQPHAAQILNVTTNETMTLLYGRQPAGLATTNLSSFATITTNFTAAWCFSNFGYTTNNFATVITFPIVQATVQDQLWGSFSNALGSNTITFQ